MATRPQLPHGAQAIQQAASFVVLLAVGLTSFGLVMVYSTSSAQRAALGEDMAYGLVRQAIWVVLGVGLAWLVARTPLTTLRRLAGPLLVVVLLLLAITLGFAPSVKGARRWLRLGALSMQPSEFAKIAVLLFLGLPFVTYFVEGGFSVLLRNIGLTTHYSSLGRGVLDMRDLLYFGSVIYLFTFLTTRMVESRKWS